MDYGKALRIARAVAGLGQNELAAAADIDASHVSLIERGARKPSIRSIAKLCRALGIPEPLFNMLATESEDLKGIEEQEFQRVGVYLARFLTRSEPRKHVRRKRPA